MRPARALLLLAAVLLAVGGLAAAADALDWRWQFEIELWFWCGFALVALIALLDGWAIRAPRLEVERGLGEHLALGVRQWVELRLVNRDSRTLQLSVTDFPPDKVEAEGLPVALTLETDASARLRYAITPLERGPARWGRIGCRLLSTWGLWEKIFYLGETAQSRIYPNYKPLFRSAFVGSDKLYSDLGLHLRQRRGEGTDFNQLRDFRVGDSLRQIDWRATARFRKPISREYQEERDQQVVFLLDCGRRMRARDGDLSHFDHALNALLISAFVALRQGDSVGLLSFAGQPRWVAPVKGRHQISRLLDQIYDLHSTPSASDFLDAAQDLMARQPRRALVVLISSLEPQDRDDLAAAARLLGRRHLVLVASMRQQVLTDTLAAELVNLDDALQYCGVTRHLQEQASMYAGLRGDNVIVADTRPAAMHAALINEYMALKRSGAF